MSFPLLRARGENQSSEKGEEDGIGVEHAIGTPRSSDSSMSSRRAARLAWGISCFAMAAPSLVLLYLNRAAVDSFNSSNVFGLVATVTFGALGGVVASRRPKNPIGWLMLGIAVGNGVSAFAWLIALRALLAGASPHGWSRWFAWVHGWIGGLVGGAFILVFLLFPDGKPFSSRWRWIVKLTVIVSIAGTVFSALAPASAKLASHLPSLSNPIGVPAVKGFSGPPSLALAILVLLALVSLVRRLRRSRGDERQQLKLFAYAVSVSLGLVIVAIPLPLISQALSDAVFNGAILFGFAFAIPGAVAFAILRYGLYDIDVVINKTVVFGALAGFITAVYVGIVVGIGEAIGQGTSKPNLGLSILATALVAVAFQPVRERIQRFANRLVYGKRATPYEVLSEFGHRMASTYAADDVLPRMARILAEGTGAKEARVWLKVGEGLTAAASWPDGEANSSRPRLDATDLLVPVTHQGEELGALTITKAPGERLSPAEEKLTTDLASQAGLVLRNVKLIEDLKASRVRLVQAQDQERRRIERNIHDGAQQQLVALNVKLGLARRLTGDPAKLDPILTQLQQETNAALQDLRDLARGIYPPLLADQGLVAALQCQARKSAVPVTLEAGGVGLYPQEQEAAVYFCALEALQNVAKYAGAAKATVRLAGIDGDLTFAVTDDGAGFDPQKTSYGTGLQGMADRLSALVGRLPVTASSCEGTTVTGRIPVVAPERSRAGPSG